MADQVEFADQWAVVLEELALQMTRATFDTWLRGSFVMGSEQDPEGGPIRLEIGVPNAYAVDWLQNRLLGVVLRTVERIAGRPAVIRFGVGRPAQTAREKDPEVDTIEETGPILEAVREEKVSVGPAGGALQWTDFYIKFKVAFRKRGLGQLKGAPLSVFICLSLHVDRNGIAKPGGIDAIMHETRYSRGSVCSALQYLERAGLIRKLSQYHGSDHFQVLGYAWFGQKPAPALWESKSRK